MWFLAVFGLIAVGGAVLWPRAGLLARGRTLREVRQRALAEDALKHLHATAWRQRRATLLSLAGALHLSPQAAIRLVRQMEAQAWVVSRDESARLTADGERLAIEVIRAHRLWEGYLANEARMPLADIHAEAERREHVRPTEVVQALDAAMGYPATDPHGDPIPTADGQLAESVTQPLTDWPLNTLARIAHLEDEPAVIFSQLIAEGLHPGQIVRVIESTPQCLVLSDGERVHTLAPVVAANVFVKPDGALAERLPATTLIALHRGQQATVHQLDESLQGFTRRRLLDLGLTPGALVMAELPSMFSDPVAYRVRGTLIALRREQAEKVIVTEITESQPR